MIGVGEHDQRRRRRQGQQQAHLDRPVLRVARRLVLAGAELPAQHRQQRRADGDADDPERQLVQPVGVEQVGDGAHRQQRGEPGVDDDVDLVDAGADGTRQHQREQPLDPGRDPRPLQAERHAVAPGRHRHPGELQDAGDEDAPGEGMRRRLRVQAGHQQRADQHHVEDDRREGRSREPADRVQDAAEQRRQRDEHQVGKGDPAELDRQGVALAVGREARGQAADHDRAWQSRARSTTTSSTVRHHRERLPGEAPRLVLALALERAREQRHEGGVEGALGEQPAEEIGELEADEEAVGHRRGAEHARDHEVADEAQHARDQREGADGHGRLDDVQRRLSTLGSAIAAFSSFSSRSILARLASFMPNTSLT